MRDKRTRNEVEVKLRVADISEVRRRLRRLHARVLRPRIHEWNTLYDAPGKTLGRQGKLIRIRMERPAPRGRQETPHSPARVVLTYKGPPAPPLGKKSGMSRRYKVRKEFEITIGNSEQMSNLLAELHLRPVFRYEKFRTTYSLQSLANLKIELDETPIGVYLELEGPPPAIDRMAHLLGYSLGDYIVGTYGSLYRDFCRHQGIKSSDLVFRTRKK